VTLWRAVTNFINGVANFQNIETQFGSLPYPKIMSFDDAGVDGRIFRQGRAIWHRRRPGAQAALRDEVDRDTRLVLVSF